MASLHCHSCHWSQDDFWNFGFHRYGYWKRWRYNPFSCFLSHMFGCQGLWQPRRIEFDRWYAEQQGWRSHLRHSWIMAVYAFARIFKKFAQQHWWTEASWRRAIQQNGGVWPCCPKCKAPDLDID